MGPFQRAIAGSIRRSPSEDKIRVRASLVSCKAHFHVTFSISNVRTKKKMKIDSPPDPLFLPPCSRALAPVIPREDLFPQYTSVSSFEFQKIAPAGASIARLRALAALRTRRLAGRLRRPFGLRPGGSARTATSLRLQPELEENASRPIGTATSPREASTDQAAYLCDSAKITQQ